MNSDKQILITRLEAFRRSLDKASDKQKMQFISNTTGEQYESFRKEAARLIPAIATSIPPSLTPDFSGMTYCEKYVDLQINVEQLVSLVELPTT